ncbi:hypothetical protein B0H12DRAFT_1070512 [Mycena haematopus]|nr:hypothetical protein B0H12DRAFT_1070512 [Mycena haematopus]
MAWAPIFDAERGSEYLPIRLCIKYFDRAAQLPAVRLGALAGTTWTHLGSSVNHPSLRQRNITSLDLSFDSLQITAFRPIVESFLALVDFRMETSWNRLAEPLGETYTAQLAEFSPFPRSIETIAIVWLTDIGPAGNANVEVKPTARLACAALATAHPSLRASGPESWTVDSCEYVALGGRRWGAAYCRPALVLVIHVVSGFGSERLSGNGSRQIEQEGGRD